MVASKIARAVDLDVGNLEHALLHAVGQDMRDLVDQAFLVRLHHLAGLLRQRQIGREHLGIVGKPSCT